MKQSLAVWLLVMVTAAVGAGRLFVPGHGLSWPGTYEAVAHLWVGFLFGVIAFRPAVRKPAAVSLLLVTALETVAFILR